MVEHQTHSLEVAGSNPGVANKYFHPRKSEDKYYPQWDHVYLDADAHFFFLNAPSAKDDNHL